MKYVKPYLSKDREGYCLLQVVVLGVKTLIFSYFRELPPTQFSYTFTDLMAGQPYVVSLITKLADKQTDPVTQTFTTGTFISLSDLLELF